MCVDTVYTFSSWGT